jgi:hypothetical protein
MSPQGDSLAGFLQIVRTEMKNTGFEPVTSTSPWRFFRDFQCFPTSQVIDRHPLEPIWLSRSCRISHSIGVHCSTQRPRSLWPFNVGCKIAFRSVFELTNRVFFVEDTTPVCADSSMTSLCRPAPTGKDAS